MAERTNAMAAPRPLLRWVLSFREPLLLIPYLLSFLGAAASALARSHSSLLHSLARALFPSTNAKHAAPSSAATATAAAAAATCPDDDAALSKAEVEAIMATMGLAAAGCGEGLAPAMALDDVRGLFDAEEPSFADASAAADASARQRGGGRERERRTRAADASVAVASSAVQSQSRRRTRARAAERGRARASALIGIETGRFFPSVFRQFLCSV